MNCKQGDLAVIRPSYRLKSEVGRIVQVVRAGLDREVVMMKCGGEAVCRGAPLHDVGWLCDANSDEYPCFIADSHLRPIRPDEGADETLTWKSVPTTPEKVPA